VAFGNGREKFGKKIQDCIDFILTMNFTGFYLGYTTG
jgi:hypothetical protein